MAGTGGKREGAGRPPGSLNKTTKDIKALAQSFGPAAIYALAEQAGLLFDDQGQRIGEPSKNDQARNAAIRELLDRGYGKARQPISGPDADEQTQPLQVVYRWSKPGGDDASE